MVHRTPRVLLFPAIYLLILISPTTGVPQNKSDDKDEKIKIAIKRTKKAAEVLKQVASLPEGKGIPKDITAKMNLIGVIPDAS